MSEVTSEQVNIEASVEQSQTPEATFEPIPYGYVKGVAILDLPSDLYIPPEALEIFLDTFEGPLDLLLYLIKKQNLDILDIPIAEITRQYIEYVELMKSLHLELAAEYLVMAAMLAEIKSRMLLPKSPSDESEEDDPRAELIRRLQEYERYKKAAEELDTLPRRERDTFAAIANYETPSVAKKLPGVALKELLLALKDVMRQAALRSHHHVQKEALSVRERMSRILTQLENNEFIVFSKFFDLEEGRAGVVVTFIAILELLKETMIEIVQAELFAPIHIRARAVMV